MIRQIAVGDIMTRNVTSVSPKTNLHLCSKEMVKNRINSVLITENKKLIGILTARDILWTITKKPKAELDKIKAIDVATRKIAVIKPSADIGQAFHKMKKFGFRRLPVLIKGEVVGIVTLKDILRVDPTIYGEILKFIDVKEEQQKLRKIADQDSWDSEGICDECEAFGQLLRVEGRPLCQDCRNELY